MGAAAEGGFCGIEEGFDGIGVGHVHAERDGARRVIRGAIELGGKLFCSGGIGAVAENEGGAEGSKVDGDTATHAAGGAGDDGDTARERECVGHVVDRLAYYSN